MEVKFVAEIVKSESPFHTGGPLTFLPENNYRELIRNKLRGYQLGDKIRVTIDDDIDWHSDKQRKFFHKLCELYGRHPNVQMGKDEVKKLMKVKWGVSEEYHYNDHAFLLMKSTSRYTKQEYVRLIEGVISDCLQAEVNIDNEVTEYEDDRVTSFYFDEKNQGLFDE